VVDVVNVNGFEPRVAERLRELVREVARTYAVAPGDDVGKFRDARAHERLFDVGSHARLARRRPRVEGQIAALRADDDLVAREALFVQTPHGLADRALAALEAVVGCRVYYVRAEFDGARHCIRVCAVGLLVRAAEVCSDAD